MATTLATWTIDPVHSSVEFSPDALRPPEGRERLRSELSNFNHSGGIGELTDALVRGVPESR